MATQVQEVTSTTGQNCSFQHEQTGGAEGAVQDRTVSSTTGVHDPAVVAGLIQLMEEAVNDSTAAPVPYPEVHAAALQLLDESFVGMEDLFE